MTDKSYQCEVHVKVTYLPEQSDVAEHQYVFAYHVTITNTGNIAAQLVSRHWVICDADQTQHEVKGIGVVGEQPVISPSQQHQYTSHTVIKTPNGYMHGSYQMVAVDGTRFDATVHPFTLSVPSALH